MNVEVENLPNCITTLKVEVPQEKVASAFEKVTREYLQYAKIPGYRPGKAPRNVVASKFKKQIREEVEKTLLTESCREAISENHLRVLQLSNVEDVELDEQSGLRFTATLVTAPAFDLPDYMNTEVPEVSLEVSDEEVEETLHGLRERHADFTDIAGRPLQMEDFAVIDYRGTIDGKPVDEAVPKAGKPLSQNDDFWLKLTPQAFFPGFSDQLVGANVGDSRSFDIDVPADFPMTDLAGQQIHYEVTIKGAKEQVLPELDDAFASKILEGKSLEEIRSMTRYELEHQKRRDADRERKNAIMKHLLDQVECELPENMVRHETRRLLADIVRENQVRGVSDEALKESEKGLIESAGRSARDRLKGTFILLRIAEAEDIKVTREEFQQRVALMAMRYNLKPDKMLKELESRNAVDQVNEEILTGKVLDFLSSNANVHGISPAGSQAPA